MNHNGPHFDVTQAYAGRIRPGTFIHSAVGDAIEAGITLRPIEGEDWELSEVHFAREKGSALTKTTIEIVCGNQRAVISVQVRVPDSALELLALINPGEEHAGDGTGRGQ